MSSHSSACLESLPSELLLHILSRLPVADINAARLTCRRLHQIASSDDIWFHILRDVLLGIGRDVSPRTAAHSECLLREMDGGVANLTRESLKKQDPTMTWRRACEELYTSSRIGYHEAVYRSCPLDAAPVAANPGGGSNSSLLLLEMVLIGTSDSRMAEFFYKAKFGPAWNGIRYLNSFGELLSLRFEKPALRMKTSVQKFLNRRPIDFSPMGQQQYPRALIVCLGSERQFLATEAAAITVEDPDDRRTREERPELCARDILQEWLAAEANQRLPVLIFVRSRESMARTEQLVGDAGEPAMTPATVVSHLGGLSAMNGREGKRPWRVQQCDFDQALHMAGVGAGLHWLHYAGLALRS